ncbi:hypothetical protein KSC_033590 [Ktedonobacter sp. SOSP1-52]|nr:hypothetical protein KSC_033590 [Ktedonobacter sp. SOSP1-52]
MLDHNCHQFGIQLTQRSPGMLRSPLINVPLTFPKLEEQLNGTITNDSATRSCTE